MTPNTEAAKEYFNTNFAKNGKFSEYSSAYAVTNENLRDTLKFVPKNTENALVVAGSGDHPMFTALRHAKNIDAFDITYNARLIMDIKTAAVQLLDYDEYNQIIIDLFNSGDKIESVKNMSKIIRQLVPSEQRYIKEMRGYKLFYHGSHPAMYKNRPLPTKPEFDKMRKIIDKPFKFIWSDLQTLSKKLNKSYDFMHLSNVVDYLDKNTGSDAIFSLAKHARPGCVMCIEALDSRIPMTALNQCNKNTKDEKWTIWHAQKSELYLLKRER